MTKVCERLVRERENEIRRQAVHSTQMRNELSCYSHSVQDIEQMLKKNMSYYTSGPFMRMKRDIERIFRPAMLRQTVMRRLLRHRKIRIQRATGTRKGGNDSRLQYMCNV